MDTIHGSLCLNCCAYAVCVGNCSTYHYHAISLLYLSSTKNVFSLFLYVAGRVPVFLLSKHAWVCLVISNSSCGWCVLILWSEGLRRVLFIKTLAFSSFGIHALRTWKWRTNTDILGASSDLSLYLAEIANIAEEGVWWVSRRTVYRLKTGGSI